MSANLPALRDSITKAQGEFAKGLPGHITPERFVRTAQTAVAHTRNIDKVKDTRSLLTEISKAANDGLILDGREAALVIDYQGNAQYRPMMRGLLKLAYNSGEIRSITVEVARDGDAFTYKPTDPEPIHHEINLRGERGEVFAYYAIARLRDGGIVFEVMTRADVHRIRDRSDAYRAFKAGKIKSTPWGTDEVEMGRKTVFRRLSKYLPSSTDRDRFQQAVERIDDDYSFEIDGEATEAKPAPQTQKRRGGGAAALKNVTPQKREAETVEHPSGDYDAETGEFIQERDDYGDDRGPGDDI